MHVAPRSWTGGERPPTGAVPCHICRPITTNMARRARAESSRVSPPPERQPAQWHLFAYHVNAGCAMEVTALSSHHGFAPKDRGLPPVQYPSTLLGPIPISARATRVPAARWRSQLARRTAVLRLRIEERGPPPVHCPFMMRRPITTSATRRARTASSRVLPPSERQPAQWRLFAYHVNAGCAMEVTALSSHHGFAPKDRGLPPVQYPSTLLGPSTISASRRACAANFRKSANSQETATAVALVRVPRECRPRFGDHSSHVAPRCCA